MKSLFLLLIIFTFTFAGFTQDYKLDDLVLKFFDGTSVDVTYEEGTALFGIESVDALNRLHGVNEVRKPFFNEFENSYAMWYVVYFPEDKTNILDIIAAYQNIQEVEIAEPDYIYELFDEFIPNDPLFELQEPPVPGIRVDQWSLRNDGNIGTLWGNPIPAIEDADMKATDFWGLADFYNLQNFQKTIAIIDIGLDWQHPDFYEALGINGDESNIWQNIEGGEGQWNQGEDFDGDGHTVEWNGSTWVFDPGDTNGVDDDNNTYIDDFIGWDLVEGDNDPNIGYDSHGTIISGGAAARTNNLTGMAGSAYYTKVMFFNCGTGSGIVGSNAVFAINYAVDKGADIISMSFGGFGNNFFSTAVQYAYENNVLPLASAGNDRTQASQYPASNDYAISVGGIRPDYTRYGQYNDAIEILAPAVDIVSLKYNNDYQTGGSGTSFSCPLAAGAIAGIWSQFPEMTNAEIHQKVVSNAFDVEPYNLQIYAGKSGSGLINMLEAFNTQSSLSLKIDAINVDPVNDSRLSRGETADLSIGIKNMGIDLTGVNATITSNDPYISISSNNSEYNDMDFLAVEEPLTYFEISAVGFPPMGYVAEIQMDIDTDQGNYQLNIPVLIEDNLHPNIPTLPDGVSFVKICDIDKNGIEDIITLSNKKLYLFRHNEIPINYEFSSSNFLANFVCAIGNIDNNDTDNEIIIEFEEFSFHPYTAATKLAILKYNSIQNSIELIKIENLTSERDSNIPLIADLNNDGIDEILVNVENDLIYYKYDPGTNSLVELWRRTKSLARLPVVADVNQDGKNELIVSHSSIIEILDASGNEIISKTIDTGISTPTIADVNNDGLLDIVCFSTNQYNGKYRNQVWVLNSTDLTEISSSNPGLFSSYADYENPVLVYNLDNDPELEILFHHEDNLLLFLDHNAMSNYTPMQNGMLSASFPFIGELEGYNFPLILQSEAGGSLSIVGGVNSGRYLMCWKNDGSFAFDNSENNILETYEGTKSAHSAIIDYDGDENYDIVVGTNNNIYNYHGNYSLKPAKISWRQENKNFTNNKLFAQTFNSSFEPASGLNTIVWNYGYETPVILYETVTIPQGVELIITPGSRIYFQPGAKLEIDGTLTAIGTEIDSIYFASFSNEPGQQGLGLVFSDPELPSTNSLELSHCSFKNLSIGVIVDIQWSALTEINNSYFSNCNVGISLNYAQSPLIEHCVIKNNIIGLEINGSSPQIFANTITNNSQYGLIFITSSGDVAGHTKSDYQLISNNGFSAADPPGGGIYCLNGSAPVFEKTEKDGDYGYNQIINNYHYGVKAEMESPVILGHDYGNNSIHSNSEYEVRAYEGSEVTANQIWWGTNNPGNELFDWDGSSYIDYSEYLESDPFEGEGKISSSKSHVAKLTNLNVVKSVSLQRSQKVIEGDKSNFTLPTEDLIGSFRGWYVKKNLIELKSLILQNIRNTSFSTDKISVVMSYLSNLFIQKKDTSFIPFVTQFARIKSDSILYKQFCNLKPAHLLLSGKTDEAYRICNSNLISFKDTSSQTGNLYTQFRIQLYIKDNLEEAKKVYNVLISQYPESELAVLAGINLASYEGTVPKLNKTGGNALVIENEEIPKVFALSQNYPNPFNPVTTIKYQLPKTSKVKLEIFNVLGQRIKTLVDEQKEAAYYELQWDGRNDWGKQSSTGIYFYRLTAEALDSSNNFVKNKKMLLIR